jgi:integrase
MPDAKLQSRTARDRLPVARKPHWSAIRPGLHLGYIKRRGGKPGRWTVRSYIGNVKTLAAPGKRGGKTPYVTKLLRGVADDYEDPNGVSVLSFAQAQELALAPSQPLQPSGPLTVSRAIESYVTFLRDHGRERAAKDAENRLRLHVPPLLGDHQVASLTAEQLRGWLADVARTGQRLRPDGDQAERRSKATANRVWAPFRAALHHAYADGLVKSDAAWRGRVRPFHNVDVSRKRWLRVDECRRLINASQGPFRLLVQSALHTGMRYGELTRLRVQDFNEDSGTVSVWQSKSGKARHVHLTEEGEAFFRELTAGRSGDEFMLRREDGGPWRSSNQHRPMVEAVQGASITPSISFHGLRHTYASLSIMNGVPLMVVAQNLGHADTRMCERHYGHLADSHKRDMIRDYAPRFGIGGEGKVKALRRK